MYLFSINMAILGYHVLIFRGVHHSVHGKSVRFIRQNLTTDSDLSTSIKKETEATMLQISPPQVHTGKIEKIPKDLIIKYRLFFQEHPNHQNSNQQLSFQWIGKKSLKNNILWFTTRSVFPKSQLWMPGFRGAGKMASWANLQTPMEKTVVTQRDDASKSLVEEVLFHQTSI